MYGVVPVHFFEWRIPVFLCWGLASITICTCFGRVSSIMNQPTNTHAGPAGILYFEISRDISGGECNHLRFSLSKAFSEGHKHNAEK